MNEEEILINEINSVKAEYEEWNINIRQAFDYVSYIEESIYCNGEDINHMRELVGDTSISIQAMLDEKEKLLDRIKLTSMNYYDEVEREYREKNINYEDKLNSLYNRLKVI